MKAAKALKEKGETPEELLQSIKENEAAAVEAQRTVDAWKAIVGEKSRREEAAKAEAERIATEKAEAERKAAEERERAEKEEKARIEAEKKEAERIAAEKAEEEARVEAERKAEEERKTKEEERKERDENGQPFVVSSDGTTTFGEITEDTGLTVAPIKLSEGVADEKGNGYGLRHIEARHGDQIRKAGFSSVEEFIEQVAKNYDVIKEGSDRNGNKTYRLLLTDKHNNTLMIELSKDGSYWNVNTAGVFKKSYGKDKKEVYNRHTTVKQSAETAETSQADEHSGTQSTSRMNVPTTSADKGTTLPADQQTSDKENTKKVADSEGENTLKSKIEVASADVNTDPTEAQKEAGNYKKGHVQVGTFDITIEQPEGSIRRGTDADGKKWESKMHNTYGYFRGTEGVDGDHIDVFLSNDIDGWNGRKVFVVDQYNPDGTFDEHKVMLGFNDMDEAKSDYLANYEKGWENGRRITVSTTNLEDFEKWIDSSHRKTKPFSEYSSVNKETVATDKGGEKAEKKQKKQSVFDKAKEIADKEEKKRKAEAEDDSVLGQATRAVGKKKKVNRFKYTASKIISYPALRGVHYANGYAYASDGYILFKEKADYPKEWEGTTRDKDGNLIDGKYPDAEKAIHRLVHIPDKEVESLPSKEVLNFAIAAGKKLKRETIPVAIDGLFFNAVNLKKFLEAVASKGMDKVVYRHPMLYATNGKDEIIMMPTVNTLEDALDIADKMESAGLPKEQIDAWKAHIEAADKKMSLEDFKKAVENAKKEGVRPTEAERQKQKELTEAERKDAEEVAGALGYRVEWVDTMAENGTIDADKKVIRIAKDAENPLVQVLGHEVAHGVKRMDGGKFKALQKAAMEVVGEKEWNERIEKKRKLNAYAEGKLAEEVTCDIVGEALNDKDALKRLAESLRGERGILARLRDAVARMVEYFKNRGDKEGVRRMKAADRLLAEFESALKEGVAPEQVKPEGVDRSVRESRSEKTELTAEERELRDNLVERMRKGGLDVVTDSEEMQRVIDTENERTRNMFVGERGATEADKAEEVSTRLDNLSVARRMEEAGKDAKTIKMATGWERGSDGKWRYETSDIKPKPFEEWMDKKNLKLGDIIDSDSGLFEMYPKLKDFKVTRGKGKSTNAAIYTGLGKIGINFSKFKPYMSIPSNREKIDGILHRVINHEIQHAIQDSEGFAQGVSPNAFRPDAPIGKLREMEEADGRMVERYNAMSYTEKALGEGVRLKERILENRKEYNALASKYRFGMDGYTRAAGEVEARNTEKRIGMTEEERRASLASETEDVAREDQILLGVDNADGEMNTGSVREHRVYHGSGADFDAFDHSYMGEGEGAQAYGWGTYVTEVEGIGRTYANATAHNYNNALRPLERKKDSILTSLRIEALELDSARGGLRVAVKAKAKAEENYEEFLKRREEIEEKYGKHSTQYDDYLWNSPYAIAVRAIEHYENEIKERETELHSLQKDLEETRKQIENIAKEYPHHLYTAEIPDDNGSNYLDWNGHPAESLLKDVGSFLESEGFERVQDNPARYEKGESTVVLNPKATGADLYAELREALGSDKKASQALAELGYTGIKYPADNMRGGREDGAKNYVIFNENDAKITDHVRFLRTAGGEVYGLVKDGRIYLDPKVATAETAVHEYTHLWGDMLRRKDSEQWSHTVKELKNSVLWEEVKESYPELKTDDEIADEVLSTFSGRRGAERLREEARRVADGEGGVFTKAKAIETLERVKEAIARFWEGVARMFGINRYRSTEELADMAMRDLLDSKNPMKDESGMRKRGEVGETLATSGTYFSGGGLLEAGLKGVIDPKVAVEFSEKIAGVYADNHGNHIVVADVRDVDPKKLVGAVDGGEVQYFHASPVCKNFSKAKREGGEVELDKETALSTAEFIAKTRPKVVTIENVKGYRNSEALKIITDELTRQGYDWDADVYNAADYGGYTKRERLIVRAKRDGKLPPKPEKLPEELRKKGWYSAVEDLIPHLEEKKTGVPQGTDERLKNSGIDYRTIDKPLYVFGRGYANKTVGHAFADELLPTLTTGGGDIIIMPDGRVLKASPRVLARVTGLPDTYKMPETDQLSHTIVGNGIPTQLTEGVIAPLLDNAIPSAERATKRESVFDVADRVSQNLEARTRAMGSRVEKRMADVAQKLEGRELTAEQKAVVDVFSGEKDNQKFSVERNGVKQQFLLKQGQEDKAGAKHSLYRHYGTNTGVITADDVLKIPQVLERGERIEKAKGGKKMAVYTMDIDGVKYTVLTRVGKNNEIVDDFYSNKKGSESSVYRNVENIDNTPEGARRKDSEPSAKVEDKSESPKLFGEEIIDDGKKGSDSIDRSVRENPKNEDKPRFSRKPGESIFDYASRVSEDVDRSVRERVSARDEYEKKVKSKGFQTKEALQNSMLGLQEFMLAIDHASGNKRYIEDIPDFENPILGENRLSSVNKEEMHQVAKTQFKPLMSAVAKLSGNGKESGELYDYMFAKHGLERDAVMRQREAQKEFDKYQKANPKGTKTIGDFVASLEGKDYAGLTALTAEDGRVKSIQSQIDAIDEQMEATDNQLLLHYLGGQKKRLKVDLLNAARDAADDIRKTFENNSSHDRSDINELWSRVNEVNGNTLRKLYESGMLTKEAYNDISSMYTNYIPMRGFDQTTSADAYAYLTHGDSAFNAPIKTAKGRSSKADNPIAYMQAMAESAIMQGNRNVLVKQKMLNFVRNHPSDLASVSDVWLQYDSVADEWKPVFPDNIDANDSASVVAKKMEAFEDKMKQMAEKHPDLVQRSNEAPDIPYKVVEKGQLNEHQVLVKQNGKSYIITVNGSPRAAQAANGLTNPDTDLTGAVGKVFEGAEALNRQLSSLYTTLNPDFIGSNYVRDALYSNTMVYVKEGAKYGGSFNFNFAKYNPAEMANLYASYNKGSLDTSNETHRLFLEFMQNGGETGFVNLKQIEKRKSEIAKAIKRDGRISAAQIWGGLSDAVDFANRAVENSARFAAYVTSRKSGRSVGRSVYDAKEISVNFNRKGSGSKFMGAEGQTKAGNAAAFVSGAGRGILMNYPCLQKDR